MKKKDRLDQILVDRQIFNSRESARTAIMDGGILVNGVKITKPGQATNCEANIEVVASYRRCPYVSRGGLKLEKALHVFNLQTAGRIALDAGASTGGFTDCLLKNEAKFVYAVDVGYGQIDWSLRQSPQVKVVERCNIRYLTRAELYQQGQAEANLAVADLSFISITKVLAAINSLLAENEKELVILVKPQFEAGKGKIEKGGVVRDLAVHKEVLGVVLAHCLSLQLSPWGLTASPIKGPSGNIEYLLWLKNRLPAVCSLPTDLAAYCTGLIDSALAEAALLNQA